MARLIGDGVYHFLVDVAVHPNVQGRNVGTQLVQHAIASALSQGIANIALGADEHIAGFYRRWNFDDRGRYMRLKMEKQ